MPFASILVPVYNSGRILNKCLDSILAQTDPDFELVLVDDGSTDNSAAILAEYAARDSRLRVITHQVNSGTWQARSTGIAAATGEYVIFVDSDDDIEPDYVATLKEASAGTPADVYIFELEIEDLNTMGKRWQEIFPPATGKEWSGEEILCAYLDGEIPCTLCGKAYGKTLIDRTLRLELPNCYSEDFFRNFFVMLEAGRVVEVAKKLYHYRYGAGTGGRKTYTAAQFARFLRDGIAWDMIRNFAEKAKLSGDITKKIIRGKNGNCHYYFNDFFLRSIPAAEQPQALRHFVQCFGGELAGLLCQNRWINSYTSLREFGSTGLFFLKTVFRRWRRRIVRYATRILQPYSKEPLRYDKL